MIKFFQFFVNLFSGLADLTNEMSGNLAVTEILVTEAVLMTLIVGLPLGIFAARKQNGFLDYITGALGSVLSGIIPLTASLLFVCIFGNMAELVKIDGVNDFSKGFVSVALYLLMPAGMVAFPAMIKVINVIKTSAYREKNREYVRYARLKGNSEESAFDRHVFKNAIATPLRYVGRLLTIILLGAVVAENIFKVNGVGNIFIKAALFGKYDEMGVIAFWCILLVSFVKTVCDLVYFSIKLSEDKVLFSGVYEKTRGRRALALGLGSFFLAVSAVLSVADKFPMTGTEIDTMTSAIAVSMRSTLVVAVAAAAAALAVGTLLGFVLSAIGGMADVIIMSIIKFFAAIPALIIAVFLMPELDIGRWSLCLIIAIALVPGCTVAARREFAAKKHSKLHNREKLKATEPLSMSFGYMIPNTKLNLPASFFAATSTAAFTEIILSFLGFGKELFTVDGVSQGFGYLLNLNTKNVNKYALAGAIVITILFAGFHLINMFMITEPVANGISKAKLNKLLEAERLELQAEAEAEARRNELVSRTVNNEYSEPVPDKSVALRSHENTASENTVLNVEALSVGTYIDGDWRYNTHNTGFTVNRAEAVGLIGDVRASSAIERILTASKYSNEYVTEGSVTFEGRELTKLKKRAHRELLGASIAVLPADTLDKFDALKKMGRQLEEMLDIHGLPGSGAGGTKEINREVLYSTLAECGISDPEDICDKYPHELSEAELYRMMLAVTMVCEPKLLIMEEPAVYCNTEDGRDFVNTVAKLVKVKKTAVLVLSENPEVIKMLCDRVVVMYSANVVERGTLEEVFEKPLAAFTKVLLSTKNNG